MPKCRYHEVCGREGGESTEEDLCILHSQNLGKDVQLFGSVLDEHRKSRGNDFSFFVFPAPADFRGADFTKHTSFCMAKFTEVADFDEAKFTEEADFSGAEFAKRAFFKGAEFAKMACFSPWTRNYGATTFTDVADFSGAEFKEKVDFHLAKFSEAKFSEAKFTKAADFREIQFAECAYFDGATFAKRADFREAQFAECAYFDGAKFTKYAHFYLAGFTKAAYFGGATFAKVADFSRTWFAEGGHFGRTTFAEETDFGEAAFNEAADFGWAKFPKGASFSGATFIPAVSFWGATFLGRTLFTAKKNEQGHTTPIFEGVEVDFRGASIEPLDALTFRGADLRKCLFLDTDLREAEFTNVTWPKISLAKWIGKRVGVYDELSPLAPEAGGRPYPEIERLYRELKQNYEDRRDYERAGDFHYGEKEMRRKNPDISIGLKFFLTCYWATSGYAERYLRPLVWAGVLLVGCAFLYLWLGLFEPAGQGRRLCLNRVDDWLQAVHYSFRVMTLLKAEEVAKPDGYAKIVSTLQNLLGPLFLALFGLALRQRLKR